MSGSSNLHLYPSATQGLDVDFFALKDYGVPDFNQLVLTSTEEGLANNQYDFAILIKVLRRAIEFMAAHRAEAKAVYFKHMGLPTDDPFRSDCWEATANCFTVDFAISEAFFEELSAWMYSRGLTKAKVDPKAEKVWSNDLVQNV